MIKHTIGMRLGSLKQKASPILSWFVIACLIMITGLLFIMQKSEAIAQNMAANGDYSSYQ